MRRWWLAGWKLRKAGYKPALLALAICLALSYVPAYAQDTAAQYTVGDCSQVDKATLRDEIEAHALAVVNRDASPVDIDSIVQRQWDAANMDAAVDAAVAEAVNHLSTQEQYLDKFISGWWGEKAQEYAERIADEAFRSPTFQSKLNDLSTAVGREVARHVETEFAQAASVALLCLRQYVGEQYSATLFSAFERSVQADAQQVDIAATQAPVIDAFSQHQLALAGVGTILVTQLVYRLSQKLSEKIAQRVAGKVVGRVLGKAGSSLIPVAGWIIGIALVAYDLWEGTQGALPQIQEALQSEEVKTKIRTEIATAIKDDLPDQAALIALETSVSLVEQWQGFCSRYGDICAAADQNPNFRGLLDVVALDELGKLAALVSWIMNQEGRIALDESVADGSLEKLLALPEMTLIDLMAAARPSEAAGWLALAPDRMTDVVALQLPQRTDPAGLDSYTVNALLAVDTPDEVQKLLDLAPIQRDELLTVPADTLQLLAAQNSTAQLAALADRMLEPNQAPAAAAALAEEVAQGAVAVEDLSTPGADDQLNGGPADDAAAPLAVANTGSAAGATAGKDNGAVQPLQPAPAGGKMAPLSIWVLLALFAGLAVAVAAVGYVRRRRNLGSDRQG